MQQLTQKLKNGKMQVLEVPTPVLQARHVLVRNHYSVISAGTDASTVKAARSSLLEKAKARPAQVKQVVDVIQSQGITQAYRAVMKKLDVWSPLGYSTAGEIIGVGEGGSGFSIGDPVACGGLDASHAEVVCVPANLCVKLRPGADLKQAAYNTLGAIAMQGVRQAGLQLGEACAVIGLGLIGQLSALMLRASGIRVIGIDIDPDMVEMSGRHCADLALLRDTTGIEDRILQFTDGLGCDAVIITAGTDSLDPINFAGAIARKKGTIVVVGAVPTGFDREPHFYRKELQIKMSCSYGPGRYDQDYEEKGIDYPAAYVRWTENRNMLAFQELIASGKSDVSYLSTHVFKLDDAPKAYEMLLQKSEPHVGILIEYDVSKDIKSSRIDLKPKTSNLKPGSVLIGFIGAGSYAQSNLLPNIPRSSDVVLKGVMTASGTSSRSVAERFGFEFCAGDEKDILQNPEINTVFIATRHDSHAGYVLKAMNAGKHVFVEKPLCLHLEELKEIRDSHSQLSNDRKAGILMVGYNRRFSPVAQPLKEDLGGGTMAMVYRVNAGIIPADSWIQDAELGGGRIIGEVCHFVDFLTWMNGSLPVSVYASAMKVPGDLNDTLTVSLVYENGSVGTIAYFANGDKSVPKEHVEIFSSGCTGVINDFRYAAIFAGGKKKEKKLLSQDKGQKEEVRVFIDAILKGQVAPIPFEEIYSASMVTFGILESIKTGQAVRLSEFSVLSG